MCCENTRAEKELGDAFRQKEIAKVVSHRKRVLPHDRRARGGGLSLFTSPIPSQSWPTTPGCSLDFPPHHREAGQRLARRDHVTEIFSTHPHPSPKRNGNFLTTARSRRDSTAARRCHCSRSGHRKQHKNDEQESNSSAASARAARAQSKLPRVQPLRHRHVLCPGYVPPSNSTGLTTPP